ncbi:MAG: TonB-dependent receptor [Saprospiraceae bacterium]
MKLRLHVGLPLVLLMVCFSFLSVDAAFAAAMPNYDGDTENFSIAVRTVTGTVTNASDGSPLIGATVLLKGTGTGTVTDIDGNFSIEINENDAVLVISYTGFKEVEVAVGTQSTISVSLDEDTATLDEVVVIGYGVQKKRVVTGAIATLDNEKISAIPVPSGVQAMQGQVAGVDIVQTGGRPGANPTIRIRGRRSITASNDPLFVIDGIPQTSGTSAINDINPQDIESMEILKDAAATAIYGSRGANGVVIITTKRGSAGKTIVAYDGYYGTSSALRTVDMMNGPQFADLKRESRRKGWNGEIPSDDLVFTDPIEPISLANGVSTDYVDLVLDNGWQTNHQLSLRGGDAKTQFNIALGYFDEQGIISNMDFRRLTGRVNIDHKISDVFQAGVSFLATNSTQNFGSNATMGEALANNPLGVPFDEEGNIRLLPTNDGIRTNPLSELVENAVVDERTINRIFVPFYVRANVLEGLSYTVNFGPDVRLYRRGAFTGANTNRNRGGISNAGIQNDQEIGYTLENILNYNKTFGEKHSLGITALQSIQSLKFERHQTEVSNLPYESQLFYNIGTAEVKGNLVSRLQEWSLNSYMGRINYDYDNKYLFSATLRADGSSRLSEGNKWAYFPGVSVGWRLLEEPFMANASWLDELKLRASYGAVGNTSINPYQTAGALSRTVYAWDETPAFGFGLNQIPNPDLGWEISSTTNIGVDFSMLNGRFSGALEVYRTNTTDLLLARNLPFTSGYNSVLQNIGSTQSDGIEFSIGANIINNPNGFQWSMDFNISSYNEKITELALKDENGNPIDDIGNRWFIGQPIRVFFDYEKIGIYQSNEVDLAKTAENKVPGEIKLKDQNGDGIITADDRVILGTDVPDFLGGITNRFSYKGIDLSFFFFFRQGGMIGSSYHTSGSFNGLFGRYNNLDVDYWTPNNPTNEAPRPNENQEFPRSGSTLGYFDGSFVKLRNASLSYTLPTSVAAKMKMSRLKVYVSGQNLMVFSPFKTADPEVDVTNTGSLPYAGGGDSIIPATKLILFGINAEF